MLQERKKNDDLSLMQFKAVPVHQFNKFDKITKSFMVNMFYYTK